MLDLDLSALYQVPTFCLNEAVKRNRKRFPDDFMFQLAADEVKSEKPSQRPIGFAASEKRK